MNDDTPIIILLILWGLTTFLMGVHIGHQKGQIADLKQEAVDRNYATFETSRGGRTLKFVWNEVKLED